MKIVIKWVVCVLALYLAMYLFPDQVEGSTPALLATGTVIWLLNMCIRPILKFLSLPITILTLGLFGLVINGLMVWLATEVVPAGVTITSYWICFIIALLISVMNVIFLKVFRSKKNQE